MLLPSAWIFFFFLQDRIPLGISGRPGTLCSPDGLHPSLCLSTSQMLGLQLCIATSLLHHSLLTLEFLECWADCERHHPLSLPLLLQPHLAPALLPGIRENHSLGPQKQKQKQPTQRGHITAWHFAMLYGERNELGAFISVHLTNKTPQIRLVFLWLAWALRS